jgi:hypothetical protein
MLYPAELRGHPFIITSGRPRTTAVPAGEQLRQARRVEVV